MERKLASIQRVKSVEPIAGANAIVKATVLGCVYVEVDSIVRSPLIGKTENLAFVPGIGS